MSIHRWDLEAHARALRVAERDELLRALMDAAGIVPDEAPITEPIQVVRHTEQPTSWLSAG